MSRGPGRHSSPMSVLYTVHDGDTVCMVQMRCGTSTVNKVLFAGVWLYAEVDKDFVII